MPRYRTRDKERAEQLLAAGFELVSAHLPGLSEHETMQAAPKIDNPWAAPMDDLRRAALGVNSADALLERSDVTYTFEDPFNILRSEGNE